jgi:hypothetical protein
VFRVKKIIAGRECCSIQVLGSILKVKTHVFPASGIVLQRKFLSDMGLPNLMSTKISGSSTSDKINELDRVTVRQQGCSPKLLTYSPIIVIGTVCRQIPYVTKNSMSKVRGTLEPVSEFGSCVGQRPIYTSAPNIRTLSSNVTLHPFFNPGHHFVHNICTHHNAALHYIT